MKRVLVDLIISCLALIAGSYGAAKIFSPDQWDCVDPVLQWQPDPLVTKTCLNNPGKNWLLFIIIITEQCSDLTEFY